MAWLVALLGAAWGGSTTQCLVVGLGVAHLTLTQTLKSNVPSALKASVDPIVLLLEKDGSQSNMLTGGKMIRGQGIAHMPTPYHTCHGAVNLPEV